MENKLHFYGIENTSIFQPLVVYYYTGPTGSMPYAVQLHNHIQTEALTIVVLK